MPPPAGADTEATVPAPGSRPPQAGAVGGRL